MLLDDVTGELDAGAGGCWSSTLRRGGQALVTATEPDHLPLARRRHEISIRDGTPARRGAIWRAGAA